MSSWLLSIAGIILLSALCEFILPEGQINKYIRAIFSFFTIFVIISPLPKLLNKEIDLSFLSNYDITLQEDFLDEFNISMLYAIEKDLEKDLEDRGFKNIKFTFAVDEENGKVDEVKVDLRELEFLEKVMNKKEVKEICEKLIKNISQLKTSKISYLE